MIYNFCPMTALILGFTSIFDYLYDLHLYMTGSVAHVDACLTSDLGPVVQSC